MILTSSAATRQEDPVLALGRSVQVDLKYLMSSCQPLQLHIPFLPELKLPLLSTSAFNNDDTRISPPAA